MSISVIVYTAQAIKKHNISLSKNENVGSFEFTMRQVRTVTSLLPFFRKPELDVYAAHVKCFPMLRRLITRGSFLPATMRDSALLRG